MRFNIAALMMILPLFGQSAESDATAAVRAKAIQGDAICQGWLGLRYELGDEIGIPQNYAEAVKWYRKAAMQGDSWAQCSLGICYEKGHGVPQDFAEAVKWYRRGAIQGHGRSQLCLGIAYSRGKGVSQDLAEAYVWFSLSAADGIKSALLERDNAAKLLSQQVLERAQERARKLHEEIQVRMAKQ